MTFQQLRLKHPRFVYKKYSVSHSSGSVELSYEFLLEPDIYFRPTVSIPYSGSLDHLDLSPFVFSVGMAEAISYWKAACPAEFVIEADTMTEGQIRFWYDLFLHGLGEFFYRNTIDFAGPEFLRFTTDTKNVNKPGQKGSDTNIYHHGNMVTYPAKQDLVLVGGGKDSAVTLGILTKSNRTFQTMILNPSDAARALVRDTGLPRPIEVTRFMDPELIRLNTAGYLNGHTPFSAYLAFVGMTVAELYGNEHVIVSNEKSADEGNLMYRGMEINHQYSKSYRFEQMFRAYCSEFLPGKAAYFSLLRPLNDLQIGKLFSGFPEYFRDFRSCNAGRAANVWCGKCAKCAFTYMSLFPYIPMNEMKKIFGSDYYAKPEILRYVRELVGLSSTKPFDCVGTRDEAALSLILSIKRYNEEEQDIPEGLLRIYADLGISGAEEARLKAGAEAWGDTYNLPTEHLTVLRKFWESARN